MSALPLIVFDVNETLLDLGDNGADLRAHNSTTRAAMRLWFSGTSSCIPRLLPWRGCYVPFTDIDGGECDEDAGRYARHQNWGQLKRGSLPERLPRCRRIAKCQPPLRKLRNAGFRLFTLTRQPARDSEPPTPARRHPRPVRAQVQRGWREAP